MDRNSSNGHHAPSEGVVTATRGDNAIPRAVDEEGRRYTPPVNCTRKSWKLCSCTPAMRSEVAMQGRGYCSEARQLLYRRRETVFPKYWSVSTGEQKPNAQGMYSFPSPPSFIDIVDRTTSRRSSQHPMKSTPSCLPRVPTLRNNSASPKFIEPCARLLWHLLGAILQVQTNPWCPSSDPIHLNPRAILPNLMTVIHW